jgi:hypothetical protein
MHYGRDHDEREQKHGSRIDRELKRGSGDDEEIIELDRRALSRHPAPAAEGVQSERQRHSRAHNPGGSDAH